MGRQLNCLKFMLMDSATPFSPAILDCNILPSIPIILLIRLSGSLLPVATFCRILIPFYFLRKKATVIFSVMVLCHGVLPLSLSLIPKECHMKQTLNFVGGKL